MMASFPYRLAGTVVLLLLVAPYLGLALEAGPSAPAPPGSVPAFGDPIEYGRPNLRVFTDKDGLPQNAINALVFDREGYLWAGTKDGAARYDGRTWTTVAMPVEAGSTSVQSILAASDGTFWFGLKGAIVHLDHGRWDVIKDIVPAVATDVVTILETVSSSGQPVIVVGIGGDIAIFEDGRWRTESPFDDKTVGVTCTFATTSHEGEQVLWVGSLVGGVARLQNGVWTHFDVSPAQGVTCLQETTIFNGERVLLAGTYNDGILRFDGEVWKSAWDLLPKLEGGAVQCLIQSTLPDGAPMLWAGTSSGLARYEHGRWVIVGASLGMPPTPIWCLAKVDSARGSTALWIGTAGLGVVHWQLGGWATFDAAMGMKSSSIYSVLGTRSDDGSSVAWIGTNSDGVSRLERGVWTHHDGPPEAAFTQVSSMLETRDDDGQPVVWVAANPKLWKVKNGVWTSSYSNQDGLPEPINCLARGSASDGSDVVWTGTNYGVRRIEHGVVYPADPNLTLPDIRSQCLLETSTPAGTRTLWVGTQGGLTRFENGKSTIYDTNSGLPSAAILSLHERRSKGGAHTLWVGTGLGVAILDLDAPEASWTYLSTESTPALPNNTIYRVEEDAKGRLYISTNKGVARLTPRSPTPDDTSLFSVYTFTVEDGLPSNECNTGASTVDDLGRIWVGTIAGAAVFDPAREVGSTRPSPLVVERAVLPDQNRDLVSGESLAYNENHVLFEFSLLSYFREGDTRYRAQLEGYDPEPSDWSTEFRRNYISLPPGDYCFKTWGRDVYGNVSGPVSVAFSVRHAPWLTWWAYGLYAIVGLFVAYTVFRYRVRALHRRNQQLEDAIAERTTQLAHLVEDLRASEHRALEANRAKSQFLANMSHELRTPLNAILGFVQLMERDHTLDASQYESLSIISRSGEHLLGLINDVLSIAKIEAGKIALVEQTFDLHELLRTVCAMVGIRAVAKGLPLEMEIDPGLPVVVHGDEGKLRQVLVNLLGNAVKFTNKGRITVRARWSEDRQADDPNARGRATFDVCDTGCGLSEQDIARLFEAFVQTESGMRAQEGSGLGLVISRNFVRLMGGDMRVESTIGEGATFSFDVVLRVVSRDDKRSSIRRRVKGLAPGSEPQRILVVDDTSENRMLLTRLLTSIGFEVREATDGVEAVALWQSWRPHLIWMDLRMPVMDGRQATRRIRELEARESAEGETPGSRCKIIALTASAFEHDQDTFLSAGCDDFVPKPFQVSTILQKMAMYLGVQYVYEDSATVEPGARSGKVTPERISLLSAEDRDELKQSLTMGDVDASLVVVERVRGRDAVLANDLAASVRHYRFDEILDAIETLDADKPDVEHPG